MEETGWPRSCGLYAAVEIARMYLRQNSPQEFLGDLRGVSQVWASPPGKTTQPQPCTYSLTSIFRDLDLVG